MTVNLDIHIEGQNMLITLIDFDEKESYSIFCDDKNIHNATGSINLLLTNLTIGVHTLYVHSKNYESDIYNCTITKSNNYALLMDRNIITYGECVSLLIINDGRIVRLYDNNEYVQDVKENIVLNPSAGHHVFKYIDGLNGSNEVLLNVKKTESFLKIRNETDIHQLEQPIKILFEIIGLNPTGKIKLSHNDVYVKEELIDVKEFEIGDLSVGTHTIQLYYYGDKNHLDSKNDLIINIIE